MSSSSTIDAILFDFDGTLSQPGAIDFSAIRQALGCPNDTPILEFIEMISDENRRRNALAVLDGFEMEAAAATKANDTAAYIVKEFKKQGIHLGILTRNSRQSIMRAFENFEGLELSDFDFLITRDDPVKPKPSGQGVRLAAHKWGISTEQIAVVGDFSFDVEAAQRAGSYSVLLDEGSDPRLTDLACDFRIKDLGQLRQILKLSQPLKPGKLPNEILEFFLRQFDFSDPSILVSAGIGDDTAAVDIVSEDVLVLKSDPITFATDAISQYAVLVNANDIATSGAVPRWFLTTLLFPPDTTALAIRAIMNDLFCTCKGWGITLCGGHTEISDAVTRPVVIGMMAGTVRRSDLIEKKNMHTGDKILLTKSLAVEGTAIIAREFSDRLLSLGFTQEEIENARDYLAQISILPEARLASASKAATAIHDITEGGLATAVEELSIAGEHRLQINMDAIPISPLTQKIVDCLKLDPLGLIGSGSLLICCKNSTSTSLINTLQENGIPVACIGEVLAPGKGISVYQGGKLVDWPHFAVDEITRLFQH